MKHEAWKWKVLYAVAYSVLASNFDIYSLVSGAQVLNMKTKITDNEIKHAIRRWAQLVILIID